MENRGTKLWIVYYDGSCQLCSWVVRFLLRVDRPARFRFASLDSPYAAGLPTGIRAIDSVVLSDGRQHWVKSAAVLQMLRILGGGWRFFLFLRIFPRQFLDAAYDMVARQRRRLQGNAPYCILPPPAHRSRFINHDDQKMASGRVSG